jgi:sulfotransferase family protein
VAVSSMHHLWKHSIDLAGHQDLEPEEIEKRDAYRADPQAFVESGEGLFTEKRLRSLAGNWSEVVRKARHDGPRLLGENYTETRYEDLLWEPEEEVARLLRFLGADASEEVVRACVESASFERWSRGRQRGREDSMSLLRKGVAGDWKDVFTVADRSVFKEAAGEALVELGYEKAHDW